MHARQAAALRKLHLVVDAAAIVASMGLAAELHARFRGIVPLLRGIPQFSEYAAIVYLTLPLWLTLVAALQLHHSFERVWTQGELVARLTKLHVIGLLGLSVIQFLTQSVINRSLVAAFLFCTFITLYLERAAIGAWVRYQHRRGHNELRALLVGSLSRRMGDFIQDALRQPLPPRVLGYLEVPPPADGLSLPPADLPPIPRLGSIDDLGRILHEQAVDHVMFFPPSNRPEDVRESLAQCEELGITASFAVDLVQAARATPRITSVYEHPFVTFEVSPKRPEWLALKYGVDPIVAGVLIVLLSPILLAVSVAILVTMGRPILFSQPRAGLYGRNFRMLKFRSMVADAEARQAGLAAENEMSGPVFKIKHDPRITPLGRLLRKTSLDELPQLFNVLTGAMSLVGPRPLPLAEQGQIRNWQRRRLSMKPGITGLWQVSGRSQLDFEEWMLLDLEYIDAWSLGLDLAILLKTIPVVLFGRGAH